MLVSPDISPAELRALKPKGIILSGGPSSVDEEDAPRCDPEIFRLGVPVLGICYGMQLACHLMGATVSQADHREFGRASLGIAKPGPLFKAIPTTTTVWMSHGDQISDLSKAGFETIASPPTCPYASVMLERDDVRFFGVQFHPEVTHTPHGRDILQNFLYEVCGCQERLRRDRRPAHPRASWRCPRHLRALGRRRLGSRGGTHS